VFLQFQGAGLDGRRQVVKASGECGGQFVDVFFEQPGITAGDSDNAPRAARGQSVQFIDQNPPGGGTGTAAASGEFAILRSQ